MERDLVRGMAGSLVGDWRYKVDFQNLNLNHQNHHVWVERMNDEVEEELKDHILI